MVSFIVLRQSWMRYVEIKPGPRTGLSKFFDCCYSNKLPDLLLQQTARIWYILLSVAIDYLECFIECNYNGQVDCTMLRIAPGVPRFSFLGCLILSGGLNAPRMIIYCYPTTQNCPNWTRLLRISLRFERWCLFPKFRPHHCCYSSETCPF